jgi:hypothetical protein
MKLKLVELELNELSAIGVSGDGVIELSRLIDKYFYSFLMTF